MEMILKTALIAAASVIVIEIVKRSRPELVPPAVLCASIILLSLILSALRTGLDYLSDIYSSIEYGKTYLPIIVKVLAVSYVTEFAASLCDDAGEKAIASKVELGGKIAIFITAAPVFSSLLKLLSELM